MTDRFAACSLQATLSEPDPILDSKVIEISSRDQVDRDFYNASFLIGNRIPVLLHVSCIQVGLSAVVTSHHFCTCCSLRLCF